VKTETPMEAMPMGPVMEMVNFKTRDLRENGSRNRKKLKDTSPTLSMKRSSKIVSYQFIYSLSFYFRI